jgi:hypothetical protein
MQFDGIGKLEGSAAGRRSENFAIGTEAVVPEYVAEEGAASSTELPPGLARRGQRDKRVGYKLSAETRLPSATASAEDIAESVSLRISQLGALTEFLNEIPAPIYVSDQQGGSPFLTKPALRLRAASRWPARTDGASPGNCSPTRVISST